MTDIDVGSLQVSGSVEALCEVETNSVTKKPAVQVAGSATSAADKAAARKKWEQHREDLLDDALKESFPASDPPSIPHVPSS